MAQKNKVPEFVQMANEIKKNASRYAASESVKFFKESFVKGGFTDSSFKAWSKSNSPFTGKRALYKSGNLMRSIKKLSASTSRVVVVADSEYADIHNSGGTIVVTAQMKKYFWAKFYELKGKGSKAMYCRAMALKPVGSKIKVPQRQFMGNSQTLMNNFDAWFGETIKKQIEPQFKDSSVKIELRNV